MTKVLRVDFGAQALPDPEPAPQRIHIIIDASCMRKAGHVHHRKGEIPVDTARDRIDEIKAFLKMDAA